MIDYYTCAAVNLYGVITRDELVQIYNEQNADKTSSEELYTLLLPLVLKEGRYCFYKNYIVHYAFFEDLKQAEFLRNHQRDKPRYVPEKEEFLRYRFERFEDSSHWGKVLHYMYEIFGVGRNAIDGYEELRYYFSFNNGFDGFGAILDKYDLLFADEKQLQEFLNLVMNAKNNTRIWGNNGYTPFEMVKMERERNRNIEPIQKIQSKDVGRNDPCPCGSGKKYKKCCMKFDYSETAQLSMEECRTFYETWFGLMSFVNDRMDVINKKIKPEYPNAVSDMMIYKVREVLWKNPELIDEYIKEVKLPQEIIDILKLWRTRYIKGTFFILEYQSEYAVAIAANEQSKDQLYGIKGISNPVSKTLNQILPTKVEAVLLPFKGKIIYDSFLSTMPIVFGEGAKAIFHEMYEKELKKGIITKLE